MGCDIRVIFFYGKGWRWDRNIRVRGQVERYNPSFLF